MKKKQIFKRTVQRMTALMFAIVIVVSMFALSTAAASYSGSGTKQDPYIVETAEQLDGMRNNLSAHYKLGNTIDMSSFGTFTPIGYEGDRFTGSFTCDTNEDGTPKYAIKNLKVYNDAGEKFGHKKESNTGYIDYVQGKTKWQTGLFGYTDGATITNIAVINADVTSTVIGQNQMNKDFSINPGQHEPTMSTGILIGGAVNTNVSGCMVSGKVTSKSNNTGGMVGFLRNGSIMNSYSTADVTNSGYWATGGLVGQCDSGTITSCFTSGDVSGGPTEATTGGLVGQVTEGSTPVIVSCYSTGDISPDANGFSIFGFRLNYKNYEPMWAMNCYTTGSVLGFSEFINNGMELPSQNLFILSGVKGRQEGFIAASAKDIKAKFASNPDWDVSGELPMLKNVHIIKDESAYVPGTPGNNTDNQTNQGSDNNNNTNSQGSNSSKPSSNNQSGQTNGNSGNTIDKDTVTSSQGSSNSQSTNSSRPSSNNQSQQTNQNSGNTIDKDTATNSQGSSNSTNSQSVNTNSQTENIGGTTNTPGTDGEVEQTPLADVSEMIALIDELPDDPDNITIDMLDSIKRFKAAYENLGDQAFGEIPAETIKKYTASHNAIIPIVMADMKNRINSLPTLKKLKASDYDEVMAIYENYEFIGENSEFMEAEIVDKLLASVEKVKELKEKSSEESSSITLLEWIVIGILALFILSVLALNVVWTYSVVKKMKALNQDEEDQE